MDRLDADLQHVAWLGVLNIDRTSEDVAAGAAIFHFFVDVAEGLWNLIGRSPGGFEARGIAGYGFDLDCVAGVDT